MKINFQKYLENHDNIIEWAIIHMMAKHEKMLQLPEWKMKYQGGPLDTENMDVTLTINGVEVNFIECIEEIGKQNSILTTEKAKELVNEQFGDLYNKFEQIKTFMDEQIEKKKQELGW